jgi:hypothetical protein
MDSQLDPSHPTVKSNLESRKTETDKKETNSKLCIFEAKYNDLEAKKRTIHALAVPGRSRKM